MGLHGKGIFKGNPGSKGWYTKGKKRLTCWKCGGIYYEDSRNDGPRDLCMHCYFRVCTMLEAKFGYAHVDWPDEKWKEEAKKLLKREI